MMHATNFDSQQRIAQTYDRFKLSMIGMIETKNGQMMKAFPPRDFRNEIKHNLCSKQYMWQLYVRNFTKLTCEYDTIIIMRLNFVLTSNFT